MQRFHLVPLLSILYNLRSLRFYATWHRRSSAILSALNIPFTTLLTTLDLRYRAHRGSRVIAFTVHEIQQLVRSSPHLRRLSLTSCPDKVYDEVAQHCPNIQQLIINGSRPRFTTIDDESYGLKTLIPTGVSSGIALESLLARYVSSLKTLDLTQEEIYLDTIVTLDIFSTVKMPNLVTIIMDNVYWDISQQLPRVVQDTSQLEVLSLQNVCHVVPDSVFETLVLKFPNFRKLSLICCDFNDTALSNCLHSFVGGSARSSFLEILISIQEKDIQMILSLKHLQGLQV